MMLVLGSWATPARADRFRYRYVVLDEVKLPAGFVAFFPAAILDDGRVYGTLCDDGESCSASHIAFYKDGSITVLPEVGQVTCLDDANHKELSRVRDAHHRPLRSLAALPPARLHRLERFRHRPPQAARRHRADQEARAAPQ
jgi:hypothetical protein